MSFNHTKINKFAIFASDNEYDVLCVKKMSFTKIANYFILVRSNDIKADLLSSILTCFITTSNTLSRRNGSFQNMWNGCFYTINLIYKILL